MWPFRNLIVSSGASQSSHGAELQPHKAFYFGDTDQIMQAARMTNRLTGYVYLLDSAGRLRWQASGPAQVQTAFSWTVPWSDRCATCTASGQTPRWSHTQICCSPPQAWRDGVQLGRISRVCMQGSTGSTGTHRMLVDVPCWALSVCDAATSWRRPAVRHLMQCMHGWMRGCL